MAAPLSRRLAVARGDEPADLVVRGGRVFSVFTREWLETDVAVVDGWIAGPRRLRGRARRRRRPGAASCRDSSTRTCTSSRRSCSSTSSRGSCCRSGRPRSSPTRTRSPTCSAPTACTGCSTSRPDLPLDVYFMASSCVPASQFESPRRALTPGDLDGAAAPAPRDRPRRDDELPRRRSPATPSELAKLALARARRRPRTGRARPRLQAYAAAGIGSDHEAYTAEEGRERLRAGMWLLIREGSAARNLHALLPLLAEYGPGRIAFCTDDREPEHIADDGHINSIVRDAVACGIPPEDALVCATLNPALWHGLDGPRRGRTRLPADLLVLPDLEHFVPETVLKARPAGRRDPARRGARLGAPHRAHRRARAGDVPHPVERRPGARDRHRARPDRHRVARRRAAVARRRGGRRPRARPREDRRRRAPPRHRAASGSGSCAASACSAARSPRRSRTTRTTSSSSA